MPSAIPTTAMTAITTPRMISATLRHVEFFGGSIVFACLEEIHNGGFRFFQRLLTSCVDFVLVRSNLEQMKSQTRLVAASSPWPDDSVKNTDGDHALERPPTMRLQKKRMHDKFARNRQIDLQGINLLIAWSLE